MFTMIFTSPEARQCVTRDSNFEEKLDFILSKHIDMMSAEEFASVCNSSAFADYDQEQPLFPSFLRDSINTAEKWLEENAFNLDDLSSVVFSYAQILDSLDSNKADSIKNKIDSAILENANRFKVKEAVFLI